MIALCIMMSLCVFGCGAKDKIPETGELFTGIWIVEADYAVSRVGNEDTLFVDARGEKKAILGTVDGAVVTRWREWCITDGKEGDETWGCMKTPEEMEVILGNLGISKDKEIILIGETLEGWGEDARLLWHLRASGYDNVKLVNGGYDALEAAGVKKQIAGSKPVKTDVVIDTLDYSRTMTTEKLLGNYDDYKIVDVRTDEEYEGAVLYNEAQGGHLPGAIHIRYTDLFRENGTLKSNEELTEMFETAGLAKDDEIVTYCTGGIRSAYTQLVLEMCGFENSYNYDQSFWRWSVVGEVE